MIYITLQVRHVHGRDERDVSAKFLQRELAMLYQTAWTMAHKLRHGLSEDPSRRLHGFLEADAATRPVPVGAPPIPTRAWSSLLSKGYRHRRTGAANMATLSSASTGSSLAMHASPCASSHRRRTGGFP
jgi:hypothetical protein